MMVYGVSGCLHINVGGTAGEHNSACPSDRGMGAFLFLKARRISRAKRLKELMTMSGWWQKIEDAHGKK